MITYRQFLIFMSACLIAFFVILAVAVFAQDRRIPVICYHHIKTGHTRSDYYLKPDIFKGHLDWLQENGYETVTFKDVLEKGCKLPKKPIILTFDDGYKDHWEVYQELKSRGMKGVFFIITGKMLLKPYQLLQMDKDGMEIGSHSVTHKDMTKLSLADIVYETNFSKRALELILDHKIVTFAYPYGRYNEKVLSAMKASDYKFARSTDEYIMQWGDGRNFRLPVVLIRRNHKSLSVLVR